jgi:hypothetical protein
MKTPRSVFFGVGALLMLAALAQSQSWTALAHQPTVPMGTALLLTDGTVMAQQMQTTGYATGQWWRLTPDITGSYTNGTWTQLASMPSGYAPLYYASAVLSDGRAVFEGGEYNNTSQSETNLGAIYNPATNSWTSISPPSGWSEIGDAQSAVLANGKFMLGNCCSNTQALLNASTLTWTATGAGKADRNAEEGWTLIPSGDVLTVDVSDGTNSELYNPAGAGTWSSIGSTVVQLPNTTCTEIGPAVLRPTGSVFATGGTSNTATYNTTTGVWAAGPTFPGGLGVVDGPAAILTDGNVLVNTGPISPCYAVGSKFYEYNGTTLTAVVNPPRAGSDASYVGRMLVLPTGQILYTDGSTSVEVYTASGTYQTAWQPTITTFPSSVTVSSTNNAISGKQFNGLSQGAMYGDDAQMATNYPLVRIKNSSTGHVFYAKTHNHSTMGVATGSSTVSTQFDVPAATETGASTLAVVANGIPSAAVSITVNPGALSCTATPSCYLAGQGVGEVVAGQVVVSCNQATILTASATICGNSCVTDSVAPPQPVTNVGAGDATYGTAGSCALSWSWGGNNYSQNLSVP